MAKFERVVGDVLDDLLNLRDHRPEGGGRNAEQFQQSFDDELHRVFDEGGDGVLDLSDESFGGFAQRGDLFTDILDGLGSLADEFLIEVIAGLGGLLMQRVELRFEFALLARRPLLETGRQSGEDGGYARPGILNDRLASHDDAVDIARDVADQVADVVAEFLLGRVVFVGDPIGESGEVVPETEDAPADAGVAVVDPLLDLFEMLFELLAGDGDAGLPPLHGGLRKRLEQIVHLLLRGGENFLGLGAGGGAHLLFAADHLRLMAGVARHSRLARHRKGGERGLLQRDHIGARFGQRFLLLREYLGGIFLGGFFEVALRPACLGDGTVLNHFGGV